MSNYCTVSASALKAGGIFIDGATISFTPRIVNGDAADFNLAGVEQHGRAPFTTTVDSGAFSIDIPKSSASSPLNMAYIVEVTDDLTGETLLGGPLSGYGNFQTGSGDALDFDAYQPLTPPNPTVLNELLAKGDKGDKGDPGVAEAASLLSALASGYGGRVQVGEPGFADGTRRCDIILEDDGLLGRFALLVYRFGLAFDLPLDLRCGKLSHNGVNIDWSNVPASASATGTAGEKAYDSGYLYICVATNTWKRVALSTW